MQKSCMQPVRSNPVWRSAIWLIPIVFGSLWLDGARGQAPRAAIQQVWVRRVGEFLREPPGWSAVDPHETSGLAFSPDDKRVALTIAHDERLTPRDVLFNTHLFLIDTSSVEGSIRQFDLTQTCGTDVAWNPRGDAILVCGVVLHVQNGTICSVNPSPPGYPSLSRVTGPGHAWWLDSGHILRQSGEIVDSDCRPVGSFRRDQDWVINGATTGNIVLLIHSEGPRAHLECQYSVVHLESHEPLSGWPIRETTCATNAVLVPGAEALCFNLNNRKLECRELNGAKTIRLPKQINGYSIDQVSSSSTRVVAFRWEDDHAPWWTWLAAPILFVGDDPGGPALPRQKAVFDLRTGKLIYSGKARIQASRRSPFVPDWPYKLALSGKGDFLAENGVGGLELNRLPAP